MAGEAHVRTAAVLRGQGRYEEAITEIENNRSSFDDISLLPGLLQAFYAATQLPDETRARALARELADLEPALPSIQAFL